MRHSVWAGALLGCLIAATPARAEIWTEFEEALGRLAARDMVLRHGEITDPVLVSWVQGVGERVAAGGHRHRLQYRFRLLAADEDNAFSLPGGIIFVTRGLLAGLHSEDELAGVLAHEIAHAENRDFARHLRLQLAFVGLQSLLRRYSTDTAVISSHFLQLYETLRRSRKHEHQADLAGAELAFTAGYDPEALLEFLRTTGDPRSRLDRLLATHPPGSQRIQLTEARAQQLQTNDYEGLMGVAQYLTERGYWARAISKYELATRAFPEQSEPLLAIARLEARRDRALAAHQACQQVCQLAPDAPEVMALAEQLAQTPPGPLHTVALPADLHDQVAARQSALAGAADQRLAAFEQLRRGALAYQRDQQINRALFISQAIAPETSDQAYLGALMQAYWLLSQASSTHQSLITIAQRTGHLQGLSRNLLQQLLESNKVSGPEAANNVIVLAESARQALVAVQAADTEGLQALQKAAAAYRPLLSGAHLVAGALLALVASGPGQPLGRLSYSRFMLVQGDLFIAERQLTTAWQAAQQALEQTTECRVELLSLSISTLAAQTGGQQRQLVYLLAGRRVGLSATELAKVAEGQLLGQVLADRLTLAPSALTAEAPPAEASAAKYSRRGRDKGPAGAVLPGQLTVGSKGADASRAGRVTETDNLVRRDIVLRMIQQDLLGERVSPQQVTRGDEP